MTGIGKVMVIGGLLLAVAGVVVWALGRAGFRGLPGDIKVESEGMRVYVPIVTCIVLSVLATGAMWLWQLFSRK